MGGGSTRVQPNSLLSAGPSPGWDLLILTIRQRFSICTVRKDICAPGPHQTTVVWMCSSKCPERALYPSNLIHEIRKQPATGLLLWHLCPYAITRTRFGGKRETRALKRRTQAVFWKRRDLDSEVLNPAVGRYSAQGAREHKHLWRCPPLPAAVSSCSFFCQLHKSQVSLCIKGQQKSGLVPFRTRFVFPQAQEAQWLDLLFSTWMIILVGWK